MRIVYRAAAIVLTLASAFIFAVLITAATGDGELKVVNFVLFAVGAIVALVVAAVLWRRAAPK
jgi:hypothetical protein